jgi:hypothetical protein
MQKMEKTMMYVLPCPKMLKEGKMTLAISWEYMPKNIFKTSTHSEIHSNTPTRDVGLIRSFILTLGNHAELWCSRGCM